MRWSAGIVAFVVLALVPTATSAPAPHRIDLATGTVDGQRILGATVERATAALGRPDFRVGSPRRQRIGWGTPSDFTFELLLRYGRVRTIVFERGTVSEAKSGEPLVQAPARFQTMIRARYADTFAVVRPLRCRPGFCSGQFAQRHGPLHLTFGSTKTRGAFVSIWTS